MEVSSVQPGPTFLLMVNGTGLPGAQYLLANHPFVNVTDDRPALSSGNFSLTSDETAATVYKFDFNNGRLASLNGQFYIVYDRYNYFGGCYQLQVWSENLIKTPGADPSDYHTCSVDSDTQVLSCSSFGYPMTLWWDGTNIYEQLPDYWGDCFDNTDGLSGNFVQVVLVMQTLS